MNHYTIKIYNKDEGLWDERKIEKLTFPEAAMSAYNARCVLGYAWEIISICKDEKEKENV